MPRRVAVTSLLLFLAGSLPRALLCWVNPPDNCFDDHYEPIYRIVSTGQIPRHNDCWQCYHPPVFYGLSAIVARTAVTLGMKLPQTIKLLQFLVCLYGILTLAVLYAILQRLPLSDCSRLIGFGTVCFLPRHIYMSAMHSNDTISYLFVSLSVYLLLLAVDRRMPTALLWLACATITLTLFTKFTAFVILPVCWTVFALLLRHGLMPKGKQAALALVTTILIPAGALGAYVLSNLATTGRALPWNVDQHDPSRTQPRDAAPLNFYSFQPWDSLAGPPLIVPGKMHSFWTLVYSGLWFDYEPKFLYFLDPNRNWWIDYFAWLRGERGYPGDNRSLPASTTYARTALCALGLLPCALTILGGYRYARGTWNASLSGVESVKMSVFPVLLLANVAGIMALAMRLPVFSAAKASYFLNSLSAGAVFLCLGVMAVEKWARMRPFLVAWFGALFLISALHVLQIVHALW